MMDRRTVDDVLSLLRACSATTMDITGGAPELSPHFRYLVTEAKRAGAHVMDRCNLTILEEPGQEDLAGFLAELNTEVVASLPCYQEDNVDAQRGKGVFEKSISGLLRLNALGYGVPGTGRVLNLVYNPQGASLPPPQAALEVDYKGHLENEFGVRFNQLYTLTNMPIQRFGSMLISKGEFEGYMDLLRNAFQAQNLDTVMCRDLLSIDWKGYVYDCDFNQMLSLPLRVGGRPRTHVRDLLDTDLEGNPVMVADHCYGCTAGQGSSCGGALEP
jgi:radical SAM/Cys-rich protein